MGFTGYSGAVSQALESVFWSHIRVLVRLLLGLYPRVWGMSSIRAPMEAGWILPIVSIVVLFWGYLLGSLI